MTPKPKLDTSDLGTMAEAMAKRERQAWSFAAESFMQKNSRVAGSYRVRVARLAEQNKALQGALLYAKEVAKESGLDADPDFLTNCKTCFILHRVILRAEQDIPLFPTPQFMMENLSAAELTVLLNQYEECLRMAGPLVDARDLDPELVEGLAANLAQHDPNAVAEELTRYAPQQKAVLAIMLSHKIQVLKSENALLRGQIRELGETGA